MGAVNLAMALYAGGSCPDLALTVITCNANAVQGMQLDPFIWASGLEPNALHYVRVWPEANVAN